MLDNLHINDYNYSRLMKRGFYMNNHNNDNNYSQDQNQGYEYQNYPPQDMPPPNYPPPNYPPQNMPPYPPMGYMKPPQGMAIAGLVLGIVGVVFSFAFYIGLPCSILALIFGAKGRSSARKFGIPTGKGTAGVVLGIIGLILSIIFLIYVIWAVSFAVEMYSTYNSFNNW